MPPTYARVQLFLSQKAMNQYELLLIMQLHFLLQCFLTHTPTQPPILRLKLITQELVSAQARNGLLHTLVPLVITAVFCCCFEGRIVFFLLSLGAEFSKFDYTDQINYKSALVQMTVGTSLSKGQSIPRTYHGWVRWRIYWSPDFKILNCIDGFILLVNVVLNGLVCFTCIWRLFPCYRARYG